MTVSVFSETEHVSYCPIKIGVTVGVLKHEHVLHCPINIGVTASVLKHKHVLHCPIKTGVTASVLKQNTFSTVLYKSVSFVHVPCTPQDVCNWILTFHQQVNLTVISG